MKQLFSLLFTIQISLVYGQGVIGDEKNAMIEAYDISGNRIPVGNRVEPQGNKMLNDRFVAGVVKFAGVKANYHLVINFSLLDNELYFKKDTMVLAFVNLVDSFSMAVKNHGTEQIMNFKRGYPQTGGNTEKSFYQIVSDGPKVQLLKYIYKIKQDKYSYGGPVEKEYADRSKFFFYDVSNKEMHRISPSVKSIKRSLPAYNALLEKFIGQHKISNEEDLVSLASFINAGTLSE